jgi:paraquat-inducible protein B
LLEKLPRHVAKERKAILDAIDDKAAAIHAVNTDVQETLRQADITLKSLQQTTQSANDLVASTDALLARFETDESAAPVTVDDYIKAIQNVQRALSTFNKLILTVDQTGMPLISTVLDQFNRSAEERVDHIFWRLFVLIFAVGGIGIVTLTVYHLLKRNSK